MSAARQARRVRQSDIAKLAAVSQTAPATREIDSDVLVVGGGLGGVAAAIAACRSGRRVVLTEETDWVGGQLTAQAVPPDEHPWIEQFGCTGLYREFRDGIRAYYWTWYPLTAAAAKWVP